MKIRNQLGTSLIEFALVLPLLLVLLVGIIEYSVLLYDKAIITNASREGARYGTMFRSPDYATTAQVSSYTQSLLASKLITFGGATNPVILVTQSASPPSEGDTVEVQVSYTFTHLVVHNLIGSSAAVPIVAETTMSYE